jgi:hypothetical protein
MVEILALLLAAATFALLVWVARSDSRLFK